MMKYGITAATGHFGQAAVAALNELGSVLKQAF